MIRPLHLYMCTRTRFLQYCVDMYRKIFHPRHRTRMHGFCSFPLLDDKIIIRILSMHWAQCTI